MKETHYKTRQQMRRGRVAWAVIPIGSDVPISYWATKARATEEIGRLEADEAFDRDTTTGLTGQR